MLNHKPSLAVIPKLIFFLFYIIIHSACKQASETPFPGDTADFPAPVTTAIKFGPAQKIVWTDKPANLTSVSGNFNFDKLPTIKFDSLGFQSFPLPPEEVPFDFAKLPSANFNFDSLPSVPLRFKTSQLAAPEITELNSPVVKLQKADIVYDFAGPLTGTPILRLLKSTDGFTWIATPRRLCRYDGATLTEFTINGLNSSPTDMVEDKDGKLWLTTSRNGVFVFDYKSGISRNITVKEGLPHDFCYRLMVDDQNRIWVTVAPPAFSFGSPLDMGKVVVIDQANNLLKFLNSSKGLSGNTPASIKQTKDKKIWITTVHKGVNIIDLSAKRISYLTNKEGLITDSSNTLMEDVDGRIWVGAATGEIQVIEPGRRVMSRFGSAQGFQQSFSNRLAQDKNRNVWLSTESGVKVISPDLLRFKIVNRSTGLNTNGNLQAMEDQQGQMLIGSEQGLNMISRQGIAVKHIGNSEISTLMEDSRGRIWVGTLEKGIQIVDLNTGLAKIYDRNNGISDEMIQYIVEYHGKVILSTQKGGIEIIDTSLSKIERIGAAQGISAGNITSIETDQDENIWLAGTNSGLDILDLKNKKIRHIGAAEGLDDSIIIDVKRDRKGRMWFYSYKNGIGILDPESRSVKHIISSEHKPLTGAFEDNLLLHDSRGNTWLSSSRNGLFMINPSGDSVTHFLSVNGLLADQLLYLRDHEGVIYVGTRRGLNILTPPEINGKGSWKIEGFGKANGIEKSIASYNSDLLRRNGDYWWGDDGITIINNKDRKLRDTVVPPTFITGIGILNKRQRFIPRPEKSLSPKDTLWTGKPGKDSFVLAGQAGLPGSIAGEIGLTWDSLTNIYHLPVNLKLPHDQNYIQFHFAQRNLGAQDTTWYRYIFDGIDQEWSKKTYHSFSENYPNISPGHYVFRVSSLSRGKWSEPVSYSFTILPPWWQTWWAYVLYTIAGVALLRAYVVYRSRKLQRENRLLEEKVTLRTNQLQKSIEDLRSTQSQLIQSEKMASLGELTAGIAHEIQNPLNFINNFSEINRELLADMKDEIDKGDIDSAKLLANDVIANEEKITHHGQRADGIVKSMLQHSRTNNNALKEPTDLSKLADEYFRLAYHGLRAKDKSFNATLKTDYDPGLVNVKVIPQDLGRVILNLITNACYAVTEKAIAAKEAGDKGYNPTVTVTTRQLTGRVEVKVADNGNGIPEKILNKIFQPFFTTKPTGKGTGLGLSMSYDIVTKGHGGELRADTRENEGTEFTIMLPV